MGAGASATPRVEPSTRPAPGAPPRLYDPPMQVARPRRVWLLGLVVALALVGCGVDPLAVLAPRARAAPERIAFVGSEGDLYTIAPDGSALTRLSQPAADGQERRSVHAWPSWSPDGQRIAVVRAEVDADGEATAGGLYVHPAAGGAPRQAFAADGVLPFFFAWAPDSRSLALLSQERGAISLRVAPADGAAGDVVASGRSLYLGWSPDGAALAAHLDGDADLAPAARVSTLPVRGGTARDLPVRPNGFRTPAYADAGRSLVVGGAAASGAPAVLSLPLDGGAPRTLLETAATPTFVLSPRGDRVAVTNESPLGSGLQIGLDVVDLASGAATRLYGGPIVAFFWSPDGLRLAWVAVDLANRQLVWYVGDGRSDPQRVTVFAPSQQLAQTLVFFDQYAATAAVWSPDSRSLLFTGWTDDLIEAPSRVWVVEATAGAQPRALADGLVATWSPPPRG
jgi:TolB protein